jgi:osmotically-inducible protein OsmY
VRIVRLLADDPTFQETGVSQAVLADKLIEARIRAILDNALPDKSVSRSIEIAVAGGKVTLSGALMQSADLNAAVENIRLIEGVTGVDNNIHRVVNYGV